ncbi:MAG: GTPase HflX [Gammaproteobacteria bacterium]|nr:GTPase HflX [Gammaproteobacteria bacterium]
MLFERPVPGDLATLVHVRFATRTTAADGGSDDGDAHRDEFRDLVRSADLVCASLVTASRDKPHPRWFVGTGKLDELASVLASTASTLVVFNHELTPAQQRNLEERLECRVMTRTELILHIFADRARTHEGILQVQLAQLTHAQTRLIRGWTHLDRQTGVGGAGGRGAGGRIGGGAQRGAGETQLEMDQRMLAVRVRQVRTRLERVRKRRAQSRRRRMRSRIPTIALAGYTNAGKSTLFNALTGSRAPAENRLFATLDPTTRRLEDTARDVVVSDTVGFIRDLPVTLVEAFKATLEEVAEADLVLHVIDAWAEDAESLRDEVIAVLAEIGAASIPTLEVWNKIDRLPPGAAPWIASGNLTRVAASALTGAGLDELREAIWSRLGLDTVTARVRVPAGEGALRAWLYRNGEVEGETVDAEGTMTVAVRLDRARLDAAGLGHLASP